MLRRAIRETIKYAASFGDKLSEDELFFRLTSRRNYTRLEVRAALINGGYQLSKKNNNQYFGEKIKKAKILAKLISEKFEEIEFVGVTGSVAAGYPKNNDDIDLMIITKKNKLWLTRLRLRYFIWKNKIPHRRYGKEQRKDEFCFNLWLDTAGLIVPKKRQHLKNAMDLVMMVPILNKDCTYERFVAENDWVKKYLATGYGQINKKTKVKKLKSKKMDYFINLIMFAGQVAFMLVRGRVDEVGLRKAFFHPTEI